MSSPLLHRTGEPLSATELTALRLDGLLVEVGEAFVPADVPETPALRLASLAPLVRPEHVVSGPTAAWVHGAGDRPPLRCHVRPHGDRRLRAPAHGRLVLHEGVVPPTDLQVMGGLRVLTVTAAMVDLARTDHVPGSRSWLSALAAMHPAEVREAVARLAAHERLPGKRTAIRVLEAVYDEVTRYTS